MIGFVEIGIIERLKAASKLKVLGYTLREVDSLPTDVDERLPEYIKNFPAAWTYLGPIRAIEKVGSSTKVEGAISVVCAAENKRSERAARFGGSDSEVGSYQIAHDIACLLMGQDLGLDIEGLELTEISPLYSAANIKARSVSLTGVRFTTRWVFEPNGSPFVDELKIGDFETFSAAWLTPAAGDLVTLPIQEPTP